MLGEQFKSFQKNKKNSSQKNAGALAVTTGLPERPPHCYGNSAFLFLWSRHIKLPECVIK